MSLSETARARAPALSRFSQELPLLQRLRRYFTPDSGFLWRTAALLIALCVVAPVITLVWFASQGSLAHWTHLLAFVLPEALRNTILLLLGVGVMVICLGVGSAWLITAYRFPGCRTLSWALLLPLAVLTALAVHRGLPIGSVLGRTRMQFRQTGFTSKASRDGHEEGWSSSFDKLATHLEAAAA